MAKSLNNIFLVLVLFTSSVLANDMIKKNVDIKKNGKPIMILFESKTCPYCDLFKKDLIENKELNTLAKEMDIYSISRDEYQEFKMWGKDTNTRSLEMTFAIKVTPNIIIFDKKARKIWQVPGYADPSIMIPYIKFVKGLDNGTFKITQWREYLQKEGIIK